MKYSVAQLAVIDRRIRTEDSRIEEMRKQVDKLNEFIEAAYGRREFYFQARGKMLEQGIDRRGES